MLCRYLLTAAALLVLCAPVAAAEAADELRAAEIAFAASVADRDAQRFASFIDEDAVFLGGTVGGLLIAMYLPIFKIAETIG